MRWIREHYGVPAKRGARVFVEFYKEYGRITGTTGEYINIRRDSARKSEMYHPTWGILYLTESCAASAMRSCRRKRRRSSK